MFDSNNQIFDIAVTSLGQQRQLLKAIEEMSELTSVLSRYLAQEDAVRDNLTAHIEEEIADVIILLNQLSKMFDIDNIKAIYDKKLERLTKRINDNYYSNNSNNVRRIPVWHNSNSATNMEYITSE